jgi:ABC-type uncharacterized transport system substrate-binding protein
MPDASLMARKTRRHAGAAGRQFDTTLNLKTAKALGIDIPTSIMLRADMVIE